MNNKLPILQLLNNGSFHFDSRSCRNENVNLFEATLCVLRWLFIEERRNVEVIQNFGLELACKLLKQGFVENSLGVKDTANTNIWKLSDDGLEVLKAITGMKP